MDDEELRIHREHAIGAVRMSMQAMRYAERRVNRSDLMMVFSTIVALTVLSAMTMRGWGGLWLAVGYWLGIVAGVVLGQRAARRRVYRRVCDEYNEIELQNMILEEKEKEDG